MTSPPRPKVRIQSIWITPKTRASTSSGTVRWMSVKNATSSTELPDADDRQQDEGERVVRQDSDECERHAPEDDAEHERRSEARQASEREGRERPDQRSDAEGGVEEPDTGLADVEELEGHDDEQHRVRACDERLR